MGISNIIPVTTFHDPDARLLALGEEQIPRILKMFPTMNVVLTPQTSSKIKDKLLKDNVKRVKPL